MTPPAANRPRVVLLTSPGLFGAEIINRLADEQEIDLVGVGLSMRVYKNKGLLATASTFLKRTGWSYFKYNVLTANVSWVALRTSRRPAGLSRAGLDVRPLVDVNAPETLEWLRGLAPDFVASFYFNQWIGPEVCAIPRRRCVNMHPSLLPHLRGPDPIFRALERKLETTGLTLHEVAREIDAGTILHQETRPVPARISHFALYLSLIHDGADRLAQWLAGQLATRVPEKSLAETGDYTTFPTPAEMTAFEKSGGRLVEWAEWRRALSQVR